MITSAVPSTVTFFTSLFSTILTNSLYEISLVVNISFAVENEADDNQTWAEISEITAEDGIDESEILLLAGEEGFLDATIETENQLGPAARAINNYGAYFSKISKTKAKFNVSVTSTTKKLKATAYLQKKSNGKYKYANKKVTFNTNNGRLNGVATIAVTKSGVYRMRIIIKEYKGTKLLSKREFYKTLDKNGY